MASIYNPDENFPFDEEIIWKRAKEFLVPADKSKPEIFANDDPKPADVMEGKLGDAWFIGALACLAEKPELLRKLFIT